MSSRRSRRPVCEINGCGSTRLHDGDDGFRYCDQGHQQSSHGTQIVEDTGELVQQGKKSRRRDESDAESTISRGAFEGPKAFEHYLLCLQLVLRKQLKWLVDVQGLPPELEDLTHDLWALRLQRLQMRVSYDSGTDAGGQSQLFSSQSEPETILSDSEVSRRQRRKRKQQEESSMIGATRIGLMDILSLCYVGTLLLRIPLTVANMHSWVTEGRLLFYNAWREIPVGMRERLPAEFQSALEPGDMVAPEKLHRKMLDTLILFNTHFGMGIPPINHPLVLYSWMVYLALPIEVFAATQRLAQLLDCDFAFTLKPKARSSLLLRLPEVRLLALLLVSTKLLFPCDDVERFAVSGEDLDALSMDWSSWETLLSNRSSDSSPELSFAESFKLDEKQCLDASDDRLDQYLDWYQNNIASENIRERGRAGQEAEFRRTLFRLFPVAAQMHSTHTRHGDDTSAPDAILDRLSQAQHSLQPRRIIRSLDVDVGRAGESYKRCRSASDLHGPLRLLYAQGAKLVGLSLDNTVEVVFRIERRLEKLEETLRKEKTSMGQLP
ncbi:hypothetical protein K431DRAFT_265547 [Polychaeton citri CBS 116435]|uniref:RRN7-type domain-containing protein n=1 Tax=Polychaeton citri CBS 116435 TaxID=1314669 RepID=A0A9P4URM5_9PEZI|nr:hypothetical protein K431DRAFT_265547 [Polychaeton citri CBS 116435]